MRRFIALALAAMGALAFLPARATPASPALFQVGFGTRNIDPDTPQPLGGFGYDDSPTKTLAKLPDGSSDHMEVRAIAIRNGADMVELAIVDTQGYFSGVQEGLWGSRDARLAAAAQIAASDATLQNFTDANIIVSSTHSHAAPTIMGIWGTPDPEYMQKVYEGTVGALTDAASSMQPAHLYAAEADVAPSIVSHVTQTDGYQGWPADGLTPILWARDPATGATLGTYVNVPVHADVVDGAGLNLISSDHIGVERANLDRDLGGTSVVAMGTLGRQESIIQVQGLAHAAALGNYVTNQVERALASARPITDATVGASQQYLLLPATNPALAVLNLGNKAADALGDDDGTHCIPGADICTINREILPPYAAGVSFGTWFNAFRIGDLFYASEPGEAFTEVSDGIRKSVLGADVRLVGMAQDQLGYYFPPETLPWTGFNNSDHHIYNASLVLGEANVQAHVVNARLLGFETAVHHETSQFEDVDGAQHAGVQFFPQLVQHADRTVSIDLRRSGSAFGNLTNGVGWTDGFGGAITVDWGDGVVTTEPPSTRESPLRSHTYAGAGSYTITASVTDPRDNHVATFTVPVIVDPALGATVSTGGGTLTAGVSGGSGWIIAAHWTFAGGSKADGLQVADPGTDGTVTVVDSAGNTASATF